MRVRLLALPLAAVLLAGCSASPEAEVRDDVRAVIAAVNDESPDRARAAVEELLATLSAQVGRGELTEAEAAPLREAALDVRDSLVELEPTPTPEPEPTEEPEETEEPTPSPTPEPEPEETVSPTPTEEPVDPTPTSETEEPQDPDQSDEPEDVEEDDPESATVVPALPVVTPTPSA